MEEITYLRERGETKWKGRMDSGYGSIDSGEVEEVDSRMLGLGVGNQFNVLEMGDEDD
jgi:hypothetical protein